MNVKSNEIREDRFIGTDRWTNCYQQTEQRHNKTSTESNFYIVGGR